MSKAKDVLMEELKKEGLDVAEDAAISLSKAVFKVLPKVLQATENKYDDLLIPLLDTIQPQVLSLLDKIDGEEG